MSQLELNEGKILRLTSPTLAKRNGLAIHLMMALLLPQLQPYS